MAITPGSNSHRRIQPLSRFTSGSGQPTLYTIFMPFIIKLEHVLFLLSFTTPLELFSFIGSFVEEVIPPIPSSLVTVSAGSMLAARHSLWFYVIWLAIFSALGKCIGATIIYFLASKIESAVIPRYGKYFGISQAEIEKFSQRFGKGWKDDITIFILRSLPIVPSFTVSIGSGILKLNFRTYLIATFFGTIIRDGILIALGYAGIDVYKKVSHWFDATGIFVGCILVVGCIFLIYVVVKKKLRHKK
jgi:membrane protein DedA with SNARE-associated domain